MKRRVFICADVKFPHGDAGSNRVQNVAKSIQNADYEVIVISHGTTERNQLLGGLMYSNGVRYENYTLRNNKLFHFFDSKLNGGNLAFNKVLNLGLRNDDIIYIYGSNAFYVNSVIHKCKKYSIRCFIDVVEWHQPHQYKFGKWNPHYVACNTTFTRLAYKTRNVMAISHCIHDYFVSKCENVCIMPVTIDSEEYPYKSSNDEHNIIHLIYPGDPCRERLDIMLKALLSLNVDQLQRFRFHITGAKENKVKEKLGKDSDLITRLKDIVIFHGWMEYEDLQTLYESADFLYMCRPNDLVKKANFPSKLPELMSRGIIPICNKVGDFWEYLSGDNSILFENEDVFDCKSALSHVLNMSDSEINKMKTAARLCSVEKFDYRKWTVTIKEFLNNIKPINK